MLAVRHGLRRGGGGLPDGRRARPPGRHRDGRWGEHQPGHRHWADRGGLRPGEEEEEKEEMFCFVFFGGEGGTSCSLFLHASVVLFCFVFGATYSM